MDSLKQPNSERGKRSRQLLRSIYRHRTLYLFLLPCLVSYAIFSYIPMAGNILAFKEFRFDMTIWQSPWVGLLYFKRFFAFYNSWNLIRNTLIFGFVKVIIEFPFPIIFAIMINEIRNQRFKKMGQTISYLPYFISMVVVAGIVKTILAPEDGVLNYVLGRMTGEQVTTFYLMEKNWYLPIIFMIDMWKGLGWGSIIYLAAITGIDPELYEVAKIDGARKFQQIWYITVQSIRPTMGILFILGLGGLISQGYEQPYLFGTPGNAPISEVLDLYVIKVGLRDGQYGYATAVGLMQGVVGLTLVTLANKVSKKISDISVW